jgi:hypothetical protein
MKNNIPAACGMPLPAQCSNSRGAAARGVQQCVPIASPATEYEKTSLLISRHGVCESPGMQQGTAISSDMRE